MFKKEEKVQRWEKKRTSARRRSDKTRRDTARKLRLGERKTRQGLKREQNRARQLDQVGAAAARSEQKTCLPTRKPKAPPMKGLPRRVRKILMAAPYGAGKSGTSEKADRARKEAERKEKKVNSGGRADRSEVHETPQKRKRKLVSELLPSKVTFQQEPPSSPTPSSPTPSSPTPSSPTPSSPTPSSPTPSPNQGQERPDRSDDEESEHGVLVEDVGPDLQEELANLWKRADAELPSKCSNQEESKPTSPLSNQEKPVSPSKQSNQEQPKSLSKLPSKETCQPPCPPLTDESDGEKVSPTSPLKLSNQEQPKSPETRTRSRVRTKVRRHVRRRKDSSSGLTSSNEDEGGEEVLIRSRRKKLVRRPRAKTPTLTSDSEEEKSKNAKLLKKTMRGGGAGGSNYYVWLQLAERIMEGVRRAQLPLRLPLDDITEGDGNCYFRAVCSQLQRPDVAASDQLRRLDHRSLRRKVCSFMLKSRLPVVQNFKRNWYEFRLGDYDQWWTDMAESKGNIWAEGPVIHATAWFLERDIYVVSEHASMDDPFIPFSGNQDGSDIACTGAALWLGHLTGLHYQTLMPLPKQSELMRPRPKLREVEETLQAKVQDTASGGDQQTSRPGPSKNSRVGEVSLIHFLWKLSSKC